MREPQEPTALPVSALQRQLAATAAARPLPPSDAHKRLVSAVDRYFQRMASQRLYVHLDKPLYQPGESIWYRVWELATPTLQSSAAAGMTVDLVSPKGATVLQKRILPRAGVATNDFQLPPDVQGGEYTLRITTDRGATVERTVLVSTYQPPRIQKTLEFLRKAYGPGDKVAVALALRQATGEPLAASQATAIVTVDEQELARFAVRTDRAGKGTVRFDLPARMARGDGLLTILVAEGGVTESIQKRIPIVLADLSLEMFAEGGDLVTGLPGRVYFAAKNPLGKAADIEGRVVDAAGRVVTDLRSFHNGLGRFELTAQAGASYAVEITKPLGIARRFPVPRAVPQGCSMMAVDDSKSEREDVRVAVWCSEAAAVIATGVLRERRLGDVSVDVTPGAPQVIALPVPPGAQGAVRVTLMNEALQPLAERLIYRGRGADMKVAITADRQSYSPRDPVSLTVQTTDLRGKPVEADLSLAVVDDTVLSFADDKTAQLLARIYLESEMPGQTIEEPNFYLSSEPKAADALDLLLGTQGWRRFDWQPVLAPPPPPMPVSATAAPMLEEGLAAGMAAGPPRGALRQPAMRPPPAPRQEPAGRVEAEKKQDMAGNGDMDKMAARPMGRIARPIGGLVDGKRAMFEADDEWWAGEAMPRQPVWAPVRQFPAPTYEGRYDGPRTDFRETIYWQPSVKTDAAGKASVRFYLSDAVTSFRAAAEGVSAGGLPGRGDAIIQSKLPVSLAVTMPLEVSAGDRIKLPVTLTNETSRSYRVGVITQFGPAFQVRGGIPATVTLAGGDKKSFFAELEVTGNGQAAQDGDILIAAETANLRDEVSQTIKVVPLGFPQDVSLAGTLDKSARHEVELAGVLPGTLEASVTMYPSPLATMVKGTQAIIREPTGCFEQASSANYPNIMVLSYVNEHGVADPALIERTMGMLDRGYNKLTGYESSTNGYEWFGGDPGHEALTAYGLMEFVDMTRVYGDVDRGMIERTKAWLRSRRDGKGGYLRNARALDSFGRASPEVTNGYITYALSEAGDKDLAAELAYQKEVAGATHDPYLLALAANVLVNLEPDAASTKRALERLLGMQAKSGAWTGADHSITRSGGDALNIETTALAVLALLDSGAGAPPPVREAVRWLDANRSGYGSFGSTQSTILALKAMTAYARASRATQTGGTVTVRVNGQAAGTLRFDAGHDDALVFDDLAPLLRPGRNVIELQLDSSITLPYSMAISYRSKMPASSADSPVTVATSLARTAVPMGEGVRMKVTVRNITDKGQPMTLARVGLPGGLRFQSWQLEELKDKQLIDFYETRAREVVLYFRSLAPGASKEVTLDLLARVPGDYVAPPSRSYLYYTDEHKHWAEPVRVSVK